MDYGWQNPEQEANDGSEHLKSLASNADCIERAAPSSTIGMRGVPFLFAIFSLQPTSDARPNDSLPQAGFRCPLRFKRHHYRLGGEKSDHANQQPLYTTIRSPRDILAAGTRCHRLVGL